ncbi:hypothetical protein [Rickettsiella endosymbiont of Dermanyssus gallinae]|uniref:hypothetical protein n=1 Tax=Rickettsiella endosymbiont of Dermanyssus gallinae TaxID=2856608 RepID=UPI001C528A9C|nr:hypothetical protein [Rickettsiella endosymbiont of Dermanyssus gallinae]
MQEITRMFKKALKSGNIVSVHNFLKKYQHEDIANWRLDADGYSALHYLSYVEVSIDDLHRRRLARLR